MTDERIEAIDLANKILIASGSGFKNYTPDSKERIVDAAETAIRDLLVRRANDTTKNG